MFDGRSQVEFEVAAIPASPIDGDPVGGAGDGVEADAAAFVALTGTRVGGVDRSQDIDGMPV